MTPDTNTNISAAFLIVHNVSQSVGLNKIKVTMN